MQMIFIFIIRTANIFHFKRLRVILLPLWKSVHLLSYTPFKLILLISSLLQGLSEEVPGGEEVEVEREREREGEGEQSNNRKGGEQEHEEGVTDEEEKVMN